MAKDLYEKQELEDFIQDWYWDEQSHEFAGRWARFCFSLWITEYDRTSRQTAVKPVSPLLL